MRKSRSAPEWRIITHTSSTRAARAVLTVLAAIALTVAAVLAPIAQSQALAAVKLKDVNSKTPHYEDVMWMADEGITKGFPDGTFQPFGDVTRCDMAAFLYRFAGSPDYTPSAADKAYFSDVDSSTPHAKEVWWLAHEGISKGWDVSGRHEFRPYESIKRCDMAAFLMRLVYGKKADVAYAPTLADAARFSDVQSSTPHSLAVWWMAYQGITTGFPDGTFRPYDTIKRCDMAAFLHRLAKSGLMEATTSSSTGSSETEPGSGTSTSTGTSAGTSDAGTTTTTPAKKTCAACDGSGQVKTGTKTVTDQEAYDEWVFDVEYDGYKEVIIDGETMTLTSDDLCFELATLAEQGKPTNWDEPVYEWVGYYVFSADGWRIEVARGGVENAENLALFREHRKELMNQGINSASYEEDEQELVDTVHHEETGQTKHHAAETHTEDVYGTCTTCGGTGKV